MLSSGVDPELVYLIFFEDAVLQSINIKKFKSILDHKIEFGRVNLIVGGNGSGKSNLLEAVGIASAALSRGLEEPDLVAKGIRLSRPAFFKSAFKNRKLPSTFRIEAEYTGGIKHAIEVMASDHASGLRFKTEKATVSGKSIFGRSGNGATVFGKPLAGEPIPTRGLYDQLRSLIDFPNNVVSLFDEFARYAIYSPQTEFLRGTEVGTAQQPPLGLHGEGLPQATDALIRHWHGLKKEENEQLKELFKLVWATGWTDQFRVGTIDPSLMSTQIKTGSETLYFRDRFLHSKRNRITAYDASEGVLFLLFLVVMLGHPESPRYFALDNVDNALNPRMTQFAVETIIKTVKSSVASHDEDRQIFLTSHNPTAMNAIDIFDDDTRIFIVSRNDVGHTQVTRLEPPKGITRERWIKQSGGKSLSELWLSDEIPGALGAII